MRRLSQNLYNVFLVKRVWRYFNFKRVNLLKGYVSQPLEKAG